MLRATIRTKLYRIPDASRGEDDDWPLPGDRSRLRSPLVTYGSDDTPDEFDILERVPAEFSYDEDPQTEGRRAKAIEESIAEHYDGFERIELEPDDGGTDKDAEDEA